MREFKYFILGSITRLELNGMNWTAITAVGTIAAACVGIIGIWLNLYEKTRRLSIISEYIPCFRIYITNNSLRSVLITKAVFSIDNHVFHIESYYGLQEVKIAPGSLETIVFQTNKVVQSYSNCKIDKICNPADKIVIRLYDNYGRKYKIKTGMTIGVFGEL